MPISRYEIRNEYSLADPELYRAADKDDPEALLEGVAMAGLVGVLRQLGDLAEFASEIFHDLHEEVMATAARGHSLTIRVQQLETEVPSIERAFLSQTDHSPFFYNSGVDWHTNLRMDQNLITQGDLPRFVMDSYEECRGPPRLFLLDKFDVAGAGACLKRYTDPSFFKFETAAISADIQREKKIRKPKKKGPRWRIGETPEVLPMSHANLHQLFLDEPVGNGVNKPARRGKLRRRLNGFLFDPKTGKSYMEKLWRTPSPEHKMLHEITTSSPLQLPSNDHDESVSDHEVLEVRSVSPARERVGRKRSSPRQGREEIMLKPFMYGANEVSPDDKTCEVSNSYLNIVTDDIPSVSDKVTGEKDITVDGESKAEGSFTGYQSDEIASEIDNYVDAPSTMESEMDTDSELRTKNDFISHNLRRQLISLENEEHLSQSSDSQSTGDLKLSDEGNNSSKKETSSFLSSDSPNTSPEKPQLEEMSAEGFPCADIPGIAIIDALSYQKIADEAFPVNQLPKSVGSNNTCTDKDTHTNNRPHSEQMTSSLRGTGSTPNLVHYGSKRVRKSRLWGPNPDETVSTSDCEEKKINLIVDSQCSPSVSDSKSRSGDDSPRCSSNEHPLDEPNGANEPSQCSPNVSDSKSRSGDDSPRCSSNEHPLDEPNGANEPCMSADSDNICHATDSSAATSTHMLHEDDYDWKDLNQFKNTSSTLNMANVLSPDRTNTAEMTSTRNPIADKMDGEVLKLPENVPSDDSDYSDIARNGDSVTPMVSNGEQPKDELEIEESNVVSDASFGKDLLETSLHNAETLNAEEHYPNGSIDHQISSETLILSPKEGSPDWPGAGADAHDREIIPEEETAVKDTPELRSPKSCEVVGLQGGEINDDVNPNDFVDLESSFHSPENLAYQAGDGINPYGGDTGLEVTEISSSADLKPLDEVHVLLDESDVQTDQSETEAMASSMLAVPDDAIREDVSLPVDLSKLVEEHTLDAIDNDKNSLIGSHVDSDLVEEDNNYLPENHKQSGLVEEVDESEATKSDLYTDSFSTISKDVPKSEVSHTVPNSHLDSKIVYAPQILSVLEQSSLDTDRESIQLNSVENQVSDETSLPINHDTEEKMLQEKIELPPVETEQDWLSLLPTNNQKMLDHEDHKEDNNSTLSSSFVDYAPSDSELPGVTNYVYDVSEYPKGTLGFIFPPSNPFSETNQMNLDELPPLPPLPPVQWRMGKLQHSSSTTEEETMMHNKELFPQQISLPTASTEDLSSSLEEMNHLLSQTVPEATLKEEKVEHETIDTPPEIENKHPQLFVPASKSEVPTQAEEVGVANESQTKKIPRPRNPLVEDVSVLDKNKLRKVTERVMPQIQKAVERDSILEQIRAKSFNLKPAATSKPSIQGPKTNLNVAAILEKANAIRQAFAGSDDDEEDNWSDS